ncbi:protein hu-li tai shao-like [Pollicipes pollicipes]|uniref:protein hu-li tai shao-like n=1 Tax=Pollicipes pollicipes TaxID=41117 RepID=UPI001884D065|nr:protein hu-li tai shao-like [Pollicipes pollicipes]
MLGTLTCGLVQCSRMEAPASTNGGGGTNGLTEEEQERQRMRPADVDADMREMARRKRVEAILSSKTFKSELDRLVETGVIDGNSVGGCLQQISDMMGLVRGGLGSSRGTDCVQPIADLRGAESSKFTKAEKVLRCKLASLFRVIDMHGWAEGIHNHITVRLSQEPDQFLVNPYGLLYGEVTASALLTADAHGALLQPGSTGLGLSAGAFGRQAAVLAARPELRCVVHVQQPAVIAADLGPHSKVLLLQNAGALCCGETVEEAFFLVSRLVAACETQWRLGELEFEALMRQLDSAGHRTGHVYRHEVHPETAGAQGDAGYYALDTDDIFKYSPMRKMAAGARAGERTRWLNQKVEVVETSGGDAKTKVSVVKFDQ